VATRRHFTQECKDQAVSPVLDSDRSIVEVARSIGVHEMTLSKWVKKARDSARVRTRTCRRRGRQPGRNHSARPSPTPPGTRASRDHPRTAPVHRSQIGQRHRQQLTSRAGLHHRGCRGDHRRVLTGAPVLERPRREGWGEVSTGAAAAGAAASGLVGSNHLLARRFTNNPAAHTVGRGAR
jgi:hypothetical protein